MSTRRLTRLGLLLALALIGATIKIPSLLGTPALDAAPGYFAALVLGPVDGAIVAAAGHLATAGLAGLPLSLPVHLVVAGLMSLAAATLGWLGFRRLAYGVVAAVLVNGLLAPALLSLLPGFTWAFFVPVVPGLLVAAAVNVTLAAGAAAAYRRLGPAAGRGGRTGRGA